MVHLYNFLINEAHEKKITTFIATCINKGVTQVSTEHHFFYWLSQALISSSSESYPKGNAEKNATAQCEQCNITLYLLYCTNSIHAHN